MIDLPANVTFGPNADSFRLDQHLDLIRSVQLFREGRRFIVELWGETALVTPHGDRDEGREFQQNADIDLDDLGGFAWHVTRWVYADETHTTDTATVFEQSGTAANSEDFRRY